MLSLPNSLLRRRGSEPFVRGDDAFVRPRSASTAIPIPGLHPRRSLDIAVGEIETLGQLQSTMATFAGYIFKLNSSQEWKPKYLMLTEDCRLYLFRDGTTASAYPITYMPVTSVSGFHDPHEDAWILKVHGEGKNQDGSFVRRNWTFRLPDENNLCLWIHNINRMLESQLDSPTSRFEPHMEDACESPPYLPRIESFASLHSDGGRSLGSLDRDKRDVEMRVKWQEYLLQIQLENAKKLRARRAAALAELEESKSLRGVALVAKAPGPIGSRGGPSVSSHKVTPLVVRATSLPAVAKGSRGGPRIS
ncbi:hypothetical protein BC830DRAFT_228247 [Chytriomyces sp. MP71]|nr:hypothetical protein BC830DRAFT_228247 [Chytriomyces sp. MP71]